ncbi:hypothetical protein V8D89_004002 [Ganoderma adspersum]
MRHSIYGLRLRHGRAQVRSEGGRPANSVSGQSQFACAVQRYVPSLRLLPSRNCRRRHRRPSRTRDAVMLSRMSGKSFPISPVISPRKRPRTVRPSVCICMAGVRSNSKGASLPSAVLVLAGPPAAPAELSARFTPSPNTPPQRHGHGTKAFQQYNNRLLASFSRASWLPFVLGAIASFVRRFEAVARPDLRLTPRPAPQPCHCLNGEWTYCLHRAPCPRPPLRPKSSFTHRIRAVHCRLSCSA